MKDILKKSIFYSFAIALTSQLSINWFTANFKISIAVVILAACGLLMSNFPLIPVTFLSAIGVFSMRMIVYWITNGHWTSPSHYMPEIAFYLCYGLLLHLYIRRFDHLSAAIHEKRNLTLGALILIDYLANFIELLVRLELNSLVLHMQSGIFLAAVMRSCLTWLVMLLFEKYRIFLIKKEHEERYQKLVLLFSKLNGEIVWMKKNTTLIEETMNNSYRLFETLRDSGADPALASSALTTAKDIHEIKKEYLLIMRGISEALEQELENDGMYLEEVLSLLKSSITNLAESQGKTLNLTYEYQKNFYTSSHYALLSIFRNLFVNALEASKTDTVNLSVTEVIEDGQAIFTVTDDGPGIPGDGSRPAGREAALCQRQTRRLRRSRPSHRQPFCSRRTDGTAAPRDGAARRRCAAGRGMAGTGRRAGDREGLHRPQRTGGRGVPHHAAGDRRSR